MLRQIFRHFAHRSTILIFSRDFSPNFTKISEKSAKQRASRPSSSGKFTSFALGKTCYWPIFPEGNPHKFPNGIRPTLRPKSLHAPSLKLCHDTIPEEQPARKRALT